MFKLLLTIAKRSLDILLPRSPGVRILEDAEAENLMRKLRHSRENLDGIISVFDYKDDLVRTLVWQIKFKGNTKLTSMAGQILYETLISELENEYLFNGIKKLILVPVPLHLTRMQERGFNQSERIAEEMMRIDGRNNFSVAYVVKRIRKTKSQTQTASREERIENMRNAFALAQNASVKGGHFVVLDDVTTTGSTINEIRKILLDAGAASVFGLTLAH